MNFALILFLASVITGFLWFFDRFVARKKRPAGTPDPWWVEYGASFFVVFLPIFLARSFWMEPFRIPSASMFPTLHTGDFILVNKYAYGIRLPVLNKKIIEVGSPQRGDVMVFRWPVNPSQDYIKRVIGLPGDKIEYINKRLTINGQVIQTQDDGGEVETGYLEREEGTRIPYAISLDKFSEKLSDKSHAMVTNKNAPPDSPSAKTQEFIENRNNCVYTVNGVTCTVPEGHYFMMGDNRDNSADSRVWGFVPEENIVGKAFFIWLHAESFIPPRGISFGRSGRFY